MKLKLIPFFFVFFSCAHFSHLPTKELQSRGFIGHWESTEGHLNIYCNGAFSSYFLSDEPFRQTRDVGTPSATTSGQHVKRITSKALLIGGLWPSSEIEFTIQEWPHASKKGMQMRIQNVQWTRTSTDSCQ